MFSRMQIDFKKYNADGIGPPPTTSPRVASYRRQPWADKSTTPMVLVHVHRFPNKQNHPRPICPNENVGAAPACPPERPHSGVSIPTNTRMVRGEFNDGCAPAGRHGRAHRHRPYQSPSYFSTQSHTNQITIHAQSNQMPSTVPRAILPNDINHPNEMRKQSIQHFGGGNASRTPAPIL